jgi:hypothetical protein
VFNFDNFELTEDEVRGDDDGDDDDDDDEDDDDTYHSETSTGATAAAAAAAAAATQPVALTSAASGTVSASGIVISSSGGKPRSGAIAISINANDTGDGVGRTIDEEDDDHLGAVPENSAAQQIKKAITKEQFATCKSCGSILPRDVDSIEAHMDSCRGGGAGAGAGGGASPRAAESSGGGGGLGAFIPFSLSRSKPVLGKGSFVSAKAGSSAGAKDINKCSTRIIYRTARQPSGAVFKVRVSPTHTLHCIG